HAGHLLLIRPWSLRAAAAIAAVVVAPLARPWLLGLPQAVPSWIAFEAPRIGDLFGADAIELAILVVLLAQDVHAVFPDQIEEFQLRLKGRPRRYVAPESLHL